MKLENKKTNPAQFVRQVRQELSKVTWPEKKDTFMSSIIVIVLIILFSIFVLFINHPIWQEWQDLNPQPPVLETGALPVELHS